MKAAVCRGFGPPEVVAIGEVPRPGVGAKDVLIRVRASTVSAGDWRLRSGIVPRGFGRFLRFGFGRSKARILGWELAGEVAAVGRSVSGLAVGDKVFAARTGCHAEYVAVPESAVAPMPANLSFGEAAAMTFGGLTALCFLRDKARIAPGERVLVNGASGAVGSAAVQLAKHFKAEVTGVCSTANMELVRSLGADHVIDYTAEDFTQNGDPFDIVLDAVGNCSFDRCRPVLAPGGRLLLLVAPLAQMVGAFLRPSRGDRKVFSGMPGVRKADLLLLRDLAESGIFKPLIDRTYSFARIVDAHAYVDTGRKKGNVVIAFD